jgi:hypothetical protein
LYFKDFFFIEDSGLLFIKEFVDSGLSVIDLLIEVRGFSDLGEAF